MLSRTSKEVIAAFGMACALLSGLMAGVGSQTTVANPMYVLGMVAALVLLSAICSVIVFLLFPASINWIPLPALAIGLLGCLEMTFRVVFRIRLTDWL
jgi:hypothetical protein